MGVGGHCYTPATLPQGQTRYTLYRRLDGPQCQFGWVQKMFPALGFSPQTVQPVARHYTDYAIPAHPIRWVEENKLFVNKSLKCLSVINIGIFGTWSLTFWWKITTLWKILLGNVVWQSKLQILYLCTNWTSNWKCWHMHTSVMNSRGCPCSGIMSVVALVKLVDWWYWYCRQQSIVVKAEWLLNRCLRRMYQRNKHGGRNHTSLVFQVTWCAALMISRPVFAYTLENTSRNSFYLFWQQGN
jgi:hypothetical protein